ncbi:MAG: hypothetical protein ACTSRK_18310 [Promethearchaeota archaeon]
MAHEIEKTFSEDLIDQIGYPAADTVGYAVTLLIEKYIRLDIEKKNKINLIQYLMSVGIYFGVNMVADNVMWFKSITGYYSFDRYMLDMGTQLYFVAETTGDEKEVIDGAIAVSFWSLIKSIEY